LPILLGAVLVAALILPVSALGANWSRSPVSPLVPGGVHSKAKFEHLLLHSTKVRSAIKAVIKADGLPSWIFSAAVVQAKAGHVYSGLLHPGTHIGAMAFGPVVTKILKHTVWTGEDSLPYYYVFATRTVGTVLTDSVADATNAVAEANYIVTTSYRVALAKTCGNPFVFRRTVTRTPLYEHFIEKRSDTTTGTLLSGWEVTGTVGVVPIDATTNASNATLIGIFPAGTHYNLTEVLKPDWVILSPALGNWNGVMPAGDLTLIFVNHYEPVIP
jgi:hypothetical protein